MDRWSRQQQQLEQQHRNQRRGKSKTPPSDTEENEDDEEGDYNWIDWYFEKELKKTDEYFDNNDNERIVEQEKEEEQVRGMSGVANISKKNELDRKWNKRIGYHGPGHDKCDCKCCEWLGNCQADLCPPLLNLDKLKRDKDPSRMFYPPIAVNVYMTNMTLEHLSRHDLVNWVNGCLEATFSSIEELASGAAYCQFLDMLFPGSIPLKKVKFDTRAVDEFVQNFKLLQVAFQKLQVDKMIPIESLVKGRFQDNFKFLQWFKKFFEANYSGRPYNAYKARGGIPLGGKKCGKCKTEFSDPRKKGGRLSMKHESLAFPSSQLQYRQQYHRDGVSKDFRCSPRL